MASDPRGAARRPPGDASSGDHDHEHGHGEHEHDHGEHEHDHGSGGGLLSRFRHAVAPHSHDPADSIDANLEGSGEGIRALKISLAALAVTAVLQLLVAISSRSVSLLGDSLHNFADALTSFPLWLAFSLGRRPPNRRFTYGYGRAEDLAGIAVVGVIAASAVIAAIEAIARLRHPIDVRHLPAVMVAAVIGLIGNESVAIYRIRTGRRIGSAALVADGLHARTDGMTSLAVFVGAIGVALGFEWADPVIGLLISAAIVVVLLSAAREVGARLMDAVTPDLVDQAEQVVASVPGVESVDELRIRWIGHRLHAETRITVDRDRTVAEAHDITEHVHHELLHKVPRLHWAVVHPDPCAHAGPDPHERTAHHFDPTTPG